MKKLLSALIVICFCQVANAQLANNSWTGTVSAGGGDINALWKLTADSSFFYSNDDNSLLDVSVITIHDSTLTIKKVSGLSGCNETQVGVYTFNITDDKLKIYLVKDECDERGEVLDKSSFIRQDAKQ
ncbi:MAG: hypothetical protein ABIN67_05260 [Ferruginibacter sp.]